MAVAVVLRTGDAVVVGALVIVFIGGAAVKVGVDVDVGIGVAVLVAVRVQLGAAVLVRAGVDVTQCTSICRSLMIVWRA